MKQIDVAIAIVTRDGQILICRRKQEGHLGGFWEFPGGKVEPGESPKQCAERELEEEVDLKCQATIPLEIINHRYPDRSVQIHPFLCTYQSGEAKQIGCDDAIWIRPAELHNYRFPEANGELIRHLIELLSH
jgi:mutator protein MutT